VIINAIRFLSEELDGWQSYRVVAGTGLYRGYVCINGDEKSLNELSAALTFALVGTADNDIIKESTLQISDNGGTNWLIHRGQDEFKVVKNGKMLAANMQKEFYEAILDVDSDDSEFKPTVETYSIKEKAGKFWGISSEDSEDPRIFMKNIVGDQITKLSSECSEISQIAELSNPKVLSQFARRIEPLISRFENLRTQARDVDAEMKKNVSTDNQFSLEDLSDQLELIERIRSLSLPLLDPSSSLKLKRAQLKTVENRIGSLIDNLDLDPRLKNLRIDDWRKPLESLCRMEAFAKLIDASHGARKYCEQKIEPSYQSYIAAIQRSLEKDKAVSAELESCLASLNLYCGSNTQELGESKAKNWFEKFKNKPADDSSDILNQSQIDTIRMAIQYVLNRLMDMQRRANDAGDIHDSILGRIDDAHEELVKNFGNLSNHWSSTSKQYGIPDDINLNLLIKQICAQTELLSLNAERDLLVSEIERHRGNLKILKVEVTKWRDSTASQRQTDLSTEIQILTEARDILKFRDQKRKQQRQWQVNQGVQQANSVMRGMVKKRKIELDKSWGDVFNDFELPIKSINSKMWGEIVSRAGIMRALALIHSTAPGANNHRVFLDTNEASLLTIYKWFNAHSDRSQKTMADYLKECSSVSNGLFQILFVNDETVFERLKKQGVGFASFVKASAINKSVAPQEILQAPQEATPRPTAVHMNERARAALDILTGHRR